MKKRFEFKRLWRGASIAVLLMLIFQLGFVFYSPQQVKADQPCADGTTALTAAGCSTHGGALTSGATTAPTAATSTAADPDKDVEDAKKCRKDPSAGLAWILCAILEVVDGGMARLRDWISNSLEIGPDVYRDPSLHNAWAAFNKMATAVLVIAGLIMIIGQAVSWGPFDAYTVKKMLPRIVAAAVLMQLSWVLITFAIQAINLIGGGISGMLLGAMDIPESHHGAKVVNMISFQDLGTDGQIFVSLIGIAALMGVGIFALVPIALGAIFAFFVAFFILLLRKVVIITLLVAAPIAIAAWAIPGGDKFFKNWREWLTKGLLMYPFIMLFLSSGAALAWVILQSDKRESVVGQITALIFYVAPYFLIPLTFRFAGGLIANLSGMVNDRSKGIIDRPKKAISDYTGKRKQTKQRIQDMEHMGDRLKADPRTWRKGYRGLAARTRAGQPIMPISKTSRRIKELIGAEAEVQADEQRKGLDLKEFMLQGAQQRMTTSQMGDEAMKVLADQTSSLFHHRPVNDTMKQAAFDWLVQNNKMPEVSNKMAEYMRTMDDPTASPEARRNASGMYAYAIRSHYKPLMDAIPHVIREQEERMHTKGAHTRAGWRREAWAFEYQKLLEARQNGNTALAQSIEQGWDDTLRAYEKGTIQLDPAVAQDLLRARRGTQQIAGGGAPAPDQIPTSVLDPMMISFAGGREYIHDVNDVVITNHANVGVQQEQARRTQAGQPLLSPAQQDTLRDNLIEQYRAKLNSKLPSVQNVQFGNGLFRNNAAAVAAARAYGQAFGQSGVGGSDIPGIVSHEELPQARGWSGGQDGPTDLPRP